MRDVQEIVHADLNGPRCIRSGKEIPLIGRADRTDYPPPVNLLRVHDELSVSLVESAGARRTNHGWSIDRIPDFPFEALQDFLPRMAQRTLVPEIVDLIPAGSWFASLANLLVGSSWSSLRNLMTGYHLGCEECGSRSALEAHELWKYEPKARVQALLNIRCLCKSCHAMQHLGRSNVVGNFAGVFRRLCTINRVTDQEKDAYADAIFDRYVERSKVEWKLDVSAAFGALHPLYLKADVLYAGENWVCRPPSEGRREVAMQIVNAEVLSDGRRLVLTRPGTSAG